MNAKSYLIKLLQTPELYWEEEEDLKPDTIQLLKEIETYLERG